MEYIKKEELKDGDVFVSQMSHNHFLNKYETGYSLHLNLDNTIKNQVLYRSGGFAYNNMRLATPEEKHWLNEAIKLDKFITFEEAMKTFIPEYVECTENHKFSAYILGKIYKVSDKGMIKDPQGGAIWKYNQYRFKPSTKEAYDAQFVVKEPLPQFKVIETIETITKVENNEGNQFFVGDRVVNKVGIVYTIKEFKYNSNNTNILAVTNIGNIIGIDKIEHYIEPKVEVEETLLEKAKRLYPVGTEFKAARGNRSLYNVTPISQFRENSDGAICIKNSGNGTIYFNGEWAEIIE